MGGIEQRGLTRRNTRRAERERKKTNENRYELYLKGAKDDKNTLDKEHVMILFRHPIPTIVESESARCRGTAFSTCQNTTHPAFFLVDKQATISKIICSDAGNVCCY